MTIRDRIWLRYLVMRLRALCWVLERASWVLERLKSFRKT